MDTCQLTTFSFSFLVGKVFFYKPKRFQVLGSLGFGETSCVQKVCINTPSTIKTPKAHSDDQRATSTESTTTIDVLEQCKRPAICELTPRVARAREIHNSRLVWRSRHESPRSTSTSRGSLSLSLSLSVLFLSHTYWHTPRRPCCHCRCFWLAGASHTYCVWRVPAIE